MVVGFCGVYVRWLLPADDCHQSDWFCRHGYPPVLNAKAKRGAAVFQQNCVSCHNKQPGDTTPFGPPNLHGIFSSKPLVTPPVTPAQATDIIKKGKAPMPAFGSILTEAQIGDLIAYLKAQ